MRLHKDDFYLKTDSKVVGWMVQLGNFGHHLVFGMSTFIVRIENDVFQTR